MFKLPISAAAAVLLVGCGSSSSTSTFTDNSRPYDAAAAESSRAFNAARQIAPTSNVPTSGTAQYSGSISHQLFSSPNNINLVGDVNLSADFNAGTISGTADNYLARVRNVGDTSATGAVTISATGFRGDNDPTLNYSGTLDVDGQAVVLNSDLNGTFRGEGGTPPTLTANGAGNSEAMVDGRQTTVITNLEASQ